MVAAAIAADVGALLARDPAADVTPELRRHGDAFYGVYVLLKDGRTFANTSRPLADDIRRDAAAVLAGTVPGQSSSGTRTLGPVVSAPIQVANELRGMVVMPPPPTGGLLQEIGRLLSLPGTVVLFVATALAAVVIFAPARRRLIALEKAAERLGRGDLAAPHLSMEATRSRAWRGRSTGWPWSSRRATKPCEPPTLCAGKCSRMSHTS